jgi:hypothetical protein
MSGNNPGFAGIAGSAVDIQEHLKRIARSLNGVLQGKLNATTTLTLTANAATTTITDARITPNSYINFMPTTANAAAVQGSIYVTNRVGSSGSVVNGTATINHTNDANTDKTFTVLIIG